MPEIPSRGPRADAEPSSPANAESPAQSPPATAGLSAPAVAVPAEAAPSPEVLKAAFKAFKKRIKVTQLDSESRIGRGPMSSGQRSTIDAITPPDQYPRAVWDELVKQKKLVPRSHGMYGLAPNA